MVHIMCMLDVIKETYHSEYIPILFGRVICAKIYKLMLATSTCSVETVVFEMMYSLVENTKYAFPFFV